MHKEENLKINFLNKTFKNPIIGFSGCFDYLDNWFSFKKDTIWNIKNLAAVTLKSLSIEPKKGNSNLIFYKDNHDNFYNSIGLYNNGVENFLNEILPNIKKNFPNTLFIMNLWETSIENYSKLLKKLNNVDNIFAFELNISCPNINNLWTIKKIKKLVISLKKISTKPILIKVPNLFLNNDSNWNFHNFITTCDKAKIDGFTISNSFPSIKVNIETQKSFFDKTIVGYSGTNIKSIMLRNIYEAKKITSLPIIASGGIMTYQNIIEAILLGANCVLLSSALLNAKKDFLKNIISELNSYCIRKKCKLEDLIGLVK